MSRIGSFHLICAVLGLLPANAVISSKWLEPGSCIHLPARTVHCLENQGEDLMKVVAVFRPAGSPAAAYYPDGTPAYQAAASE